VTSSRDAEVRRILDRYLVEVVEAFGLCPWARSARLANTIAVEILWGEPDAAAFAGAATRALADGTVAMVVAPTLTLSSAELRRVRDDVAARVPTAGVADFHPDAALDTTTPARLVPFLRRSPDPMLQLVPLAILDEVRAPPVAADRARQVAILRGAPAPVDVAASIASTNHATVSARAAEITAILDDIAADRVRCTDCPRF
jgi:hypothetical protein